MIGIEIDHAYAPVLAYARVSFLIAMYRPMYTVLAVKNDNAIELRSCVGSPATFPAIYNLVRTKFYTDRKCGRLTTAAANSGNTSMELMCAPLALARLAQTSAGNLLFHDSRFVRGLSKEGQYMDQNGLLNEDSYIAFDICPLVAAIRRTMKSGTKGSVYRSRLRSDTLCNY